MFIDAKGQLSGAISEIIIDGRTATPARGSDATTTRESSWMHRLRE
jgi:hypothetical protein